MLLYNFYTVFASEKEKKQTDDEPSKETNNHFGRIYFDVLNNENFRELSPMAFKIYGSMFEYADWKTGKCWPSQTKLARNCGCSRWTVNQKIKELVDQGYIRKEKKGINLVCYYIIAYEKQGGVSHSQQGVSHSQQGVSHSQQGVSHSQQGVSHSQHPPVSHSQHEQESLEKEINNKKQQNNTTTRDLQFDDVINTTEGVSETVETVCCRISDLFLKKFHAELPHRFIIEKINSEAEKINSGDEKINSGVFFDDQFYIQIIMTQQRMPDNPIGWWRSIDSTWVVDPNARPVDRVGRGWRVHTSTEDYAPEKERRKEESESLRASAEQIISSRLQEAVQNFPPPSEYAEQMVQRAVDTRNIMVEGRASDAKPHTDDELEEIRHKALDNYPEKDEEKRQKILFNSKSKYDVEKILIELREKAKEADISG